MSAIQPQSASRARTQTKKKANDDASYFGPSTSTSGVGQKRQAIEKPDGEPRNKRKRAEPVAQTAAKNVAVEVETRLSLVRYAVNAGVSQLLCSNRLSSTKCLWRHFTAT
jgi:hypothetical protein